MIVHVPPPTQTVDGQEGKGSFWREATFGFKYIFKRPSLFGYVLLLFTANTFLGFPNSVHVPMILLRTNNSSLILGAAETAGAISWTLGSVLMSVWGGPKRRMHGALLGWICYCIFGNIIFGLGTSLNVWIPAIIIAGFGSNIGIATSQAILQSKVAPDVQGRVFSARRMLTWFPDTFTPIIGGLLADKIMEPAMRSQGWFAQVFGWMVGTGPGSGMALIMIIFGGLTILTMSAGYLFPKIRNLEDLLPDHDQLQQVDS